MLTTKQRQDKTREQHTEGDVLSQCVIQVVVFYFADQAKFVCDFDDKSSFVYSKQLTFCV